MYKRMAAFFSGYWRAALLAALGLLALLSGVLWLTRPRELAGQQRQYSVIEAQQGEIRANVSASGVVEAQAAAELSFASGGLVEEVLVQIGDHVSAGQVLAQLRGDELRIEVRRAAAHLRQAQASLDKLVSGTRPEEREAARAQLAAAEGSLRQVQGQVTAQDRAAAEAQVQQARARLDQLLAGPRKSEVRAAEAQVQQAQARLDQLLAGPASPELGAAEAQLQQAQAQRDSARASLEQSKATLSANKTQAELSMQQAANLVRDRQAEYSRIAVNNQQLRDAGMELPQELLDAEAAALRAVENAEANLGQAIVAAEEARQREAAGVAAAEAQLQQAESAVAQAQIQLDALRGGPEPADVSAARAQLEQAQASLERLLSTPERADVSAARAQLEQAQASLEQLRGLRRAGSLETAQAQVQQAQARLEQLHSAPITSELALAQAQVDAAQAALDLANLRLEQTELRAPFAGTVAEVQLAPGASAVVRAVSLVDLSQLYIDATVDEIDVARVAVGQPAEVTLDALGSQSFQGRVSAIAPRALTQNGATSYRVRVELIAPDRAILPGMSASVTIEVAHKADVLLIPRRALHSEGQRNYVERVTGPAPPDGEPPREQVEVVTGLSNEHVVEVVQGLEAGTAVFVEGVTVNFLDLVQEERSGERR